MPAVGHKINCWQKYVNTSEKEREGASKTETESERETARRLSADDELTASGHNGRLVRLRVSACECTSTRASVCVCVSVCACE